MGLLNNFFGKNQSQHRYELPTNIDIHSHLIPGIDDGSESLEESITLVKRFVKLGYKKIITTPHIMSDFYKNTPEIIRNGLALLKAEIQNQNIEIEIDIAAEYYVDETFMKKIETEELLTFGDKYILIETNTINYSDVIRNAIWELNLNGYKPVYAHPERYSYYWKSYDSLVKLKDMGVFFQINIPSLSGYYSPTVQKICERLVNDNLVEFIGSDAHEMKYLDALEKTLTNPIMNKISKMTLLNNSL